MNRYIATVGHLDFKRRERHHQRRVFSLDTNRTDRYREGFFSEALATAIFANTAATRAVMFEAPTIALYAGNPLRSNYLEWFHCPECAVVLCPNALGMWCFWMTDYL